MKTTVLEHMRRSIFLATLLRLALRVLSVPLRLVFALTFGRLDPYALWRRSVPSGEHFQRAGAVRLLGRTWEYRIFERPPDPFMLRIFLWPSAPAKSGDPGIYLHYFFRSDADRELHNHPWTWALSLLLRGGYREHHDWGHEDYRAGQTNLILAHQFHRVELLLEFSRAYRSDFGDRADYGLGEIGCWTLFVSGPRAGAWGFADSESGDFTPATEYHRRLAQIAGLAPVAGLLGPAPSCRATHPMGSEAGTCECKCPNECKRATGAP